MDQEVSTFGKTESSFYSSNKMKTPFGNSGAAIKLAEIVENNPRSRRYVSSTLSELGAVLRNLFSVKEPSTQRYLCRLVQQQFIERVKTSQNSVRKKRRFCSM